VTIILTIKISFQIILNYSS